MLGSQNSLLSSRTTGPKVRGRRTRSQQKVRRQRRRVSASIPNMPPGQLNSISRISSSSGMATGSPAPHHHTNRRQHQHLFPRDHQRESESRQRLQRQDSDGHQSQQHSHRGHHHHQQQHDGGGGGGDGYSSCSMSSLNSLHDGGAPSSPALVGSESELSCSSVGGVQSNPRSGAAAAGALRELLRRDFGKFQRQQSKAPQPLSVKRGTCISSANSSDKFAAHEQNKIIRRKLEALQALQVVTLAVL